MQIVISLYQEDFRWIEDIPSHWDVFVYLKGCPCEKHGSLLKKATVHMLENTGRESHTWFHHIVENYDDLHQVTLFLQGNPFDHSYNIFEILQKQDIASFVPLLRDSNRKHTTVLSSDISGYIGLGDAFHYPAKKDSCWHVNDQWYEREAMWVPTIWETFYKTKDCPETAWCSWGSQFMATADVIRRFPKRTYIDMLRLHELDDIVPWSVEKILPTVFLFSGTKKIEVPLI